jgi:hypothetical protein
MVMTLEVKHADNGVPDFIQQYNAWVGYQNLYVEDHRSAVTVGASGVPCFRARDVDGINNSSGPLVLIDIFTEGLHAKNMFNKYRKNCHYIIISNGWWDQNKVSLDISYDLVWYPYFLHDMNNVYHNVYKMPFYIDKVYSRDYPKPCMFVSTIGNVSSARDNFLKTIKEHVTYDNFILKYSGVDYGIDSSDYDVVKFAPGEFDSFAIISDEHNHDVTQTIPIKMYNQAYFSLVMETIQNLSDSFFMTEKTLKALFTGIPFVIVGTPFFLRHLKGLGFSTYSGLWDESYDEELDLEKRLIKIAKLCNDLGSFNWEGNKEKLELVHSKNVLNMQQLNKSLSQSFERFEKVIKRVENG